MSAALPPASADRELLDRLLRESGVERRPLEPSLTDYILHALEAFRRWLEEALQPLGPLLRSPAFELVLWSAAAAALAVLLVHLLRQARRRPSAAKPSPSLAAAGGASPAPDREAWRATLEERLRGGDVAGALEALWWWLARSLCGGEAEASWTSRELLERSGRRDLRPLASGLDRMTYGARRPPPDEVRTLFGRLQERVP